MSDLTPDTLAAIYASAPDPPPLRGLAEVDWSALRHAHGPATDVPALLRAMASDVPDHRRFAGELLFETVWHQGDIYPATAVVVPFLYRLLAADGPHDKRTVACLIATIAEGRPPFARCEGDPAEAARWERILGRCGRSLRAEVAEGRAAAEEARRQVALGLDVLYRYLDAGLGDAPDEETRQFKAFVEQATGRRT